jgi:aminoglycoside phosphotransferase (APT) family kinase protein
VLRDHDTPADRRLLALLFAAGTPAPAAVLKLRRDEARPLAREAAALGRLAALLPYALRGSVPRALAYSSTGGRELLLLAWLPGRSAYVEMHSLFGAGRLARTHFEAAADWLGRFHDATRTGEERGDRPAARAIGVAMEEARETGGARWAEIAERTGSPPLGPTATHGDFWPGNLLVSTAPADGPACAVVDWEHFEERGDPLDDLFRFPLAYGLAFPWGRRRLAPHEAFRRTFLERNRLSRAVRVYLERYCTRAGLEVERLKPHFELYLLERASRRRPGAGAADGAERDLWLRCHRLFANADRSVFSG